MNRTTGNQKLSTIVTYRARLLFFCGKTAGFSDRVFDGRRQPRHKTGSRHDQHESATGN